MKILYLLGGFPSLSETFILNEITELIDLGHDIEIVSLRDLSQNTCHSKVKEYDLINKTNYIDYLNGDYAEEKIDDILSNYECNEELLRLCGNCDEGLEKRRALTCYKLVELIKKEGIGHIHCHFAKEQVNLAYIIGRVLDVPYTFTTHAYDIFIKPSEKIGMWAAHAAKVITISEYNKEYMVKNFGVEPGKIDVVHCGIEVDKFKSIERERGTLHILSIARLTEKKGIEYLIKACSLLNIDYKCTIIGDGELRPGFELLIKELGLERKVTLMGAATHDMVLKAIETCGVFVLPCVEASNGDKDGIPVSLMEAMASNLPVISTDVTGIPELIDDGINGLVVKQKDHQMLAEAIRRIATDEGLVRGVSSNARFKVDNEFNIKKNIKKLYAAFFSELGSKHIANIRILLDRIELLKLMPKNGIVAELGVDAGDFSSLILQHTQPEKLYLIDRWDVPRFASEDYVKKRFDDEIKKEHVDIHKGLTCEKIAEFDDNYFDWVYIDSSHDYKNTIKELELAVKKVKHTGLICGHDYTTGTIETSVKYGVVRAVHEFCIKHSWEMIYLTNESHRYLSFALRKL